MQWATKKLLRPSEEIWKRRKGKIGYTGSTIPRTPEQGKSKHCFSNQQHVGKPCRKAASEQRDSATMFSHARGISYKGDRAPLDEP